MREFLVMELFDVMLLARDMLEELLYRCSVSDGVNVDDVRLL